MDYIISTADARFILLGDAIKVILLKGLAQSINIMAGLSYDLDAMKMKWKETISMRDGGMGRNLWQAAYLGRARGRGNDIGTGHQNVSNECLWL